MSTHLCFSFFWCSFEVICWIFLIEVHLGGWTKVACDITKNAHSCAFYHPWNPQRIFLDFMCPILHPRYHLSISKLGFLFHDFSQILVIKIKPNCKETPVLAQWAGRWADHIWEPNSNIDLHAIVSLSPLGSLCSTGSHLYLMWRGQKKRSLMSALTALYWLQLTILLPDGNTFWQLKMAGAGTHGAKCKMQKHHDIWDIPSQVLC